MEVSKKYRYTVTDPCYLLSEEDWCNCWNKADKASTNGWNREVMSLEVENALRAANKGFAFACYTGFGDWDNNIHVVGGGVTISEHHFGADAGMVCVVEVTPELEEYLSKDKTNSYNIGAFFETEERVTNVNCIGSMNWEVLQIRTSRGAVIETDPDEYYEEEYDEDEDHEYVA